MLKLELASVALYSLFATCVLSYSVATQDLPTLTKLAQAKQGKQQDQTIWNPSEKIIFYSDCFIQLG